MAKEPAPCAGSCTQSSRRRLIINTGSGQLAVLAPQPKLEDLHGNQQEDLTGWPQEDGGCNQGTLAQALYRRRSNAKVRYGDSGPVPEVWLQFAPRLCAAARTVSHEAHHCLRSTAVHGIDECDLCHQGAGAVLPGSVRYRRTGDCGYRLTNHGVGRPAPNHFSTGLRVAKWCRAIRSPSSAATLCFPRKNYALLGKRATQTYGSVNITLASGDTP